MHWISEDEKEMIKEWAKEYGTEEIAKRYLSMPTVGQDSYWCMCDDGKEVMDYDFNTIPELKKILKEELCESNYEDLLLPLAVAIFKERMQTNNENVSCSAVATYSGNNDLEIPEFVYAF